MYMCMFSVFYQWTTALSICVISPPANCTAILNGGEFLGHALNFEWGSLPVCRAAIFLRNDLKKWHNGCARPAAFLLSPLLLQTWRWHSSAKLFIIQFYFLERRISFRALLHHFFCQVFPYVVVEISIAFLRRLKDIFWNDQIKLTKSDSR